MGALVLVLGVPGIMLSAGTVTSAERDFERLSARLSLQPAYAVEPSSGSAGQRPREILTGLAENVTHGWDDDQLDPDQLEARLSEGERVFITCGTVSLLGKRLLERNDIESRIVHTITRRPFNGVDDGHTMLEVREHGRWVVYDLDNNRVANDSRGRGVSVTRLVNADRRHWKMISDDRRYRSAESPDPSYTHRVYGNLDAWYDRVLGTAMIEHGDEFVFTGGSQRRRIESLGSDYRWVAPSSFAELASD